MGNPTPDVAPIRRRSNGYPIEVTGERFRRSSAVRQPMRFGRFEVIPGARQLLADGQPIEIGGRAFDLLIVLLRARGTVVAKDEIVQWVWPTTVVEESNLRFQMAALRRALGPDRDMIKTVTGRGYLLTDNGETATSDWAPS